MAGAEQARGESGTDVIGAARPFRALHTWDLIISAMENQWKALS